MTLGESAGRSRYNRVRPAARRRFSEHERDENTHLEDDPQARAWSIYDNDFVVARVSRIGSWVVLAVIGVFVGVIVLSAALRT